MSSQESKKRRLQYLYNEHQLKLEEYNHLRKSIDSTAKSGILHAILGDSQTSGLALQQLNARLNDVVSDLHRLDFDIDELESQLNENSNESNEDDATECSVFCSYCGSQMESNTVFCKECGRAQPKYLK